MTTNDATNTVSRWLGLFQSAWQAVLVLATIAMGFVNQYMRVTQLEWTMNAHIARQAADDTKNNTRMDDILAQVTEINGRLIRMEERWDATKRP